MNRIYRLMVARRVKHGMTTAAAVSKLFDEELENLIASGKDAGTPETFRQARGIGEEMNTIGAFGAI